MNTEPCTDHRVVINTPNYATMTWSLVAVFVSLAFTVTSPALAVTSVVLLVWGLCAFTRQLTRISHWQQEHPAVDWNVRAEVVSVLFWLAGLAAATITWATTLYAGHQHGIECLPVTVRLSMTCSVLVMSVASTALGKVQPRYFPDAHCAPSH